ncbi:FkbM family methyltransferase [Chlorobium phaeovibrioides]|uniref:FkbM family methyltransferase n=1 Tax=Chlorobium phaeovibrioides TaxID=1094 RepID=A0A3S0KZP1_CHLPH|nr:FkbM family methyltransferase [Chlorobium phaeovibrioides]RTY34605.1 FkbM family methyltransferase [Chlorobium phaeovibrioides]
MKPIFDVLKHLARLFMKIYFPTGPYRVKEVELFGFRALLFIDQLICQKMYLRVFERAETKVLQKLIKTDDVCIDIGANVGYYTLLFSKQASHVMSFEPIDQNADLLQLSLSTNEINNVEIFRFVCGSNSGNISFAQSEESGLSSVLSGVSPHDGMGEFGASIRNVLAKKLIRIDDIDINRLDIVKIDVEGYEAEVLAGMKNTLLRLRPRLIMIELVDSYLSSYGSSIEEVFIFMKNIDYVPMEIIGSTLMPWRGGRVINDDYFFSVRDLVVSV